MANRYFEKEEHLKLYQQYRLNPPTELIQYIIKYLKEKFDGPLNLAVDVGCGSGQNTGFFAEYFQKVVGMDVSPVQIDIATSHNKHNNVSFEASPAEKINVEDNSVQLITAMAAVHWFDIPLFLKEAYRVLSPGASIALYCYTVSQLEWEKDPSKNDKLSKAYSEQLVVANSELAEFWPAQSQHAWTRYREIEIPSPFVDICRIEDKFFQTRKVTLSHIMGQIQTWSAFQRFRDIQGEDAAQRFLNETQERLLEVVAEDLEENESSPDQVCFVEKAPFFIILARKPQEAAQ